MMKARFRVMAPLVATAALLAALPFQSAVPASAPESWSQALQGAWRQLGGDNLIHFSGERVIALEDGKLAVSRALHSTGSQLFVRTMGQVEVWCLAIDGGFLTRRRGAESRRYRRLSQVPDQVRLEPLSLGPGAALPLERLESIRQQLEQRVARDQRVRKAEESPAAIRRVEEENTRYLKQLISEIGWVDVGRFGEDSAYNAVILAKHSGDLRLMLTVMPYIESDFRQAGDNAQAFAIFYDSLQLRLGGLQRYGTQIGWGRQGDPFVQPLEDAVRVDVLREEIGLPPLAEYLAAAGEYLGGGKEIPILEENLALSVGTGSGLCAEQ